MVKTGKVNPRTPSAVSGGKADGVDKHGEPVRSGELSSMLPKLGPDKKAKKGR